MNLAYGRYGTFGYGTFGAKDIATMEAEALAKIETMYQEARGDLGLTDDASGIVVDQKTGTPFTIDSVSGLLTSVGHAGEGLAWLFHPGKVALAKQAEAEAARQAAQAEGGGTPTWVWPVVGLGVMVILAFAALAIAGGKQPAPRSRL